MYRRKVGVVPPSKNWAKKPFTFVRFFDDFDTVLRISAERNVTEAIWQRRWQVRGVSYVVSKFHKLWPIKKTGPEFYQPTLFRFVAVHRTRSMRH